jgi:hypothetical protein
MLPRKDVPMANVAAHPRGLTHASRPTLPIERHTDAPPPMQRAPSPGTRPRLGSSRSPQALERACCLEKTCQWPTSRLTPGAHPCLSPDLAHPKARLVPPVSTRSLRALERACCLEKELDASSPCLYRSYEGFTRCSRVLVRSHLRMGRGSTRGAVS